MAKYNYITKEGNEVTVHYASNKDDGILIDEVYLDFEGYQVEVPGEWRNDHLEDMRIEIEDKLKEVEL